MVSCMIGFTAPCYVYYLVQDVKLATIELLSLQCLGQIRLQIRVEFASIPCWHSDHRTVSAEEVQAKNCVL